MRTIAILSALVATITSVSNAFAQQPITETELREVIVGKSLRWNGGNITEFQADGRFTFKVSNGRPSSGTWTVTGNKLCYLWANGTSSCDQFYRDAMGPYNASSDGRQYRFTALLIEKSGPITGMLAECEQSVHFAIQPPTSDVGAVARALSGIWVGKWDSGLCAAIVVESVSSAGTARLLYVHGSLPQQALRAGSTRYDGTVAGSTITARRGAITLELVARGAGELSGRLIDRFGQASAVFVKR